MHDEPSQNTPPSTQNCTVDEMVPVVYKELCAMAERLLKGERHNHTLSASALVHEAYLRLLKNPSPNFEHRSHFFASAARTMRCILVDYAKHRGRKKRIGGRKRVSLDFEQYKATTPDEDLLVIDELLTKIGATNPELVRIIELRCFAGLTIEQTAEVLNISTSSVERGWRAAKAWLGATLHDA